MITPLALTPLFLTLASAGTPALAEGGKTRLDLAPGDHISIIGNRLAEAIQHDGWFETLVYNRFPKHDLVFRNLAFTGDEVVLRPRTDGFGSPDQNLAVLKTDVVLAFFGYNESFAGPAGLAKFRVFLSR